MRKQKKTIERREYQRFRAQEGTFAVFGPNSNKIGQITDISMGGLAFHYMPGEEPNGSKELNIFLAESSFYLRKIPFDTVWDQDARQVPFSSINIRRCGVEFGSLSDAQSSQLERFIESYTVGRA
jgi:c-di-GMP-binding flagellar brake protein YcgR